MNTALPLHLSLSTLDWLFLEARVGVLFIGVPFMPCVVPRLSPQPALINFTTMVLKVLLWDWLLTAQSQVPSLPLSTQEPKMISVGS